MQEVINFYGLGPFYFEYQNKIVNGNDWVSKRALFIFMYLLLSKKRNVSIEELVDIFWENSDLTDGKNKLYNTIYLLRRSLAKDGIPKNIIESVSGGYSINNSYKIWTDWDYFEKKTEQLIHKNDLEIEELEQLFQLYREDFFPSLRYEGWTEIQRENLRDNYLTLIGILSQKLYNAQRYRDTVNYLHSGIKYDPYRENFYLLYIKALVKLGRIAEAINSYKKCEQILRKELDVLPCEKLKNEYYKIKLTREVTGEIKTNFEENPVLNSGAMLCDLNVFEKVYELELRHVKRFKKKFILMTVNFSGIEEEVNFENIIYKVGGLLRSGDVISVSNSKIHLILPDMSLVNSGIIMQRFNNLFKDLDLKKKPSIDIKEVN